MTGLRGEIAGTLPPEMSIADARVNRDITQYMMDKVHGDNVYCPLDDPMASQLLQEQRRTWGEEGKTVVFTSGVFDLLHPNHRAYLLHTKLEAIPVRYEAYFGERSWDALQPHEQMAYCQEVLVDDQIKLIVSVDGDDAVADRKGLKEDKGGTLRPIYSWDSRARDVLGANTCLSVDGQEIRLPIADAVTIHDNVNETLAGTPHDDIVAIAAHLQPDVWSIYYESQDIIDRLRSEEGANFVHTEAIMLPGHEFYTDKLLGGRFSTTAIARRLGGAATKNGSL